MAVKELEGKRMGASPKPTTVQHYVSELNLSLPYIFSLGLFGCSQLDMLHSWIWEPQWNSFSIFLIPMGVQWMGVKFILEWLIIQIALVNGTCCASPVRHKTHKVTRDCHMPRWSISHVMCKTCEVTWNSSMPQWSMLHVSLFWSYVWCSLSIYWRLFYPISWANTPGQTFLNLNHKNKPSHYYRTCSQAFHYKTHSEGRSPTTRKERRSPVFRYGRYFLLSVIILLLENKTCTFK